MVFARGTDEPPGIGKVGQALVDSIRSLVKKKKSVRAYAVQYPASWDFLGVVDGANDASAHVQSTAAKCPSTRMVLGGYSQGAAVVDVITTSPIAGVGFKSPLPAAVADHIAAVTVFGNPSARRRSAADDAQPGVRRTDRRHVQRQRSHLFARQGLRLACPLSGVRTGQAGRPMGRRPCLSNGFR